MSTPSSSPKKRKIDTCVDSTLSDIDSKLEFPTLITEMIRNGRSRVVLDTIDNLTKSPSFLQKLEQLVQSEFEKMDQRDKDKLFNNLRHFHAFNEWNPVCQITIAGQPEGTHCCLQCRKESKQVFSFCSHDDAVRAFLRVLQGYGLRKCQASLSCHFCNHAKCIGPQNWTINDLPVMLDRVRRIDMTDHVLLVLFKMKQSYPPWIFYQPLWDQPQHDHSHDFQIHVKLVYKGDSKWITLDVKKTDTIENIMEMVDTHEDIPVDRQKMYFANKQLELGHTIEYYNIQSDSSILLRLCGDYS